MRTVVAALFLWHAASLCAGPPDLDAIVRKLGENARDPAIQENRQAVAYERESRVDYLDEERVKKRVVRRYVIAPENGQAVTRLVSVNGKPADEAEVRKASAAREAGEKGRNLELSEELLARYRFSYLGEELIGGRKTWLLRFSARPDAEPDGFFDRLLLSLGGVLWIDAEDVQLAKAEIYLAKKVSFFGGIAGAIERLDLTFVQKRLEANLWLGETSFIDFAGRKLFSAVRFRCYETCREFRRVTREDRTEAR